MQLLLVVLVLVLALVTWTVPRQLFVLTPARWRPRLYDPTSSWLPAFLLASIPLPLAYPAGYAMADPSLSPVQMGLTFAGALGGLTGAGVLFSWRRARREQLHAQAAAGPTLPPRGSGTPPWSLDLPRARSQSLTDGGALLVRGDLLSLVFHRPLHLSEVEPIMTFLLHCADLLPTFVLKDCALRTRPT